MVVQQGSLSAEVTAQLSRHTPKIFAQAKMVTQMCCLTAREARPHQGEVVLRLHLASSPTRLQDGTWTVVCMEEQYCT